MLKPGQIVVLFVIQYKSNWYSATGDQVKRNIATKHAFLILGMKHMELNFFYYLTDKGELAVHADDLPVIEVF